MPRPHLAALLALLAAAFFVDRGTVYVEASGYWRLVVLR